MPETKKTQLEKFKEAARALATDDDESRFNENLRRITAKKSEKKREKTDG